MDRDEKVTNFFLSIQREQNEGVNKITFSQAGKLNRLVEWLLEERVALKTLETINLVRVALHLSNRTGAALEGKIEQMRATSASLSLQNLPSSDELCKSTSIQEESSSFQRKKNIEAPLLTMKNEPLGRDWRELDDFLIASKINKWRGSFRSLLYIFGKNSQTISWYSLFAFCQKLHFDKSYSPYLQGNEAALLIEEIIDRLLRSGEKPPYKPQVFAQLFGATVSLVKSAPKLESFLLNNLPTNFDQLSDSELYTR